MNTITREELAEKRAAGRIVDRALTKGYTVSVWDGEEWAIKRSRNRKAIVASLSSTSDDTLTIRDADGNRVGVIWLVWGNSPEELAADYTDKPEIVALVESQS